MSKAFTLLELLVVMAIMGLLGTASVGGYRAMQRGMEERGVMASVNTLIRAAYQRAQIDRQPTVVYFWNETIRKADDDNHEVVIGKAVAVRRSGRLSDVRGQLLVDEFGDLNLSYRSSAENDDEENEGSSETENETYIYPMNRLSDMQSTTTLRRSLVKGNVVKAFETPLFLTGTKTSDADDDENGIPAYAFELVNANGVSWRPGMAYGFEFMELQLPKNYIFGSQYSQSVENPIQEAGTLVFDVGYNSGGGLTTGGTAGRNSIAVCSLRPDGETLKVEQVAQSDNPENDQQ